MSVPRRAVVVALAFVLLWTALVTHAPRAAAASGPAGTITSPITDSGLDTNGDGLYDYLAINVTVNVASAGMFAIYVNLAQPADVRTFLDVGLQTIQARVYGWSLYNAGFDGPYSVKLYLENGLNLSVLDTADYTTGAYLASEFDPPAAIIESVGTAWPVDTNGNGLYDELRLNYTLNVTGAGSFVLEAQLSSQYGGQASWTDTPTVGVGLHDLTFAFPGGLINASGLYGYFHYTLYVIQWFQESTYSVGYSVSFKSITTPTYYYYEFDPPWVRTVPPFSDHGIDVDGDGLFEEIDIRVPIHLERASNVTVSGTLGPSPLVLSNIVTEALPAGDTSVDLIFSAFAFATAHVNGPYTATVDLTASILPGYFDRETYSTTAYAFTQLSPPSASLATPGWTPVDTNSDGVYDFLDVGMHVTAAKTGDYFVQGELYPGIGSTCCLEAEHFVHLAAGATQNVTLRFSGIALNGTAMPGPWGISITATRVDGLPGDRVSTSASTSAYSASDFAWRYPAVLTGNLRSQTYGTGLGYAPVFALDPSTGFWITGQTNATGGYTLPLYNGTFTLATGYLGAGTNEPIARSVVVSGNTSADMNLPDFPRSTFSWNAAFSGWNAAWVNLTRTNALMNQTARIAADLAGNFDGIANATELSWWARYPFYLPHPYPTEFPPAGHLGLSVDGHGLATGPESFSVLQGTGGYTDTSPIVVRSSSTFRNDSAPSAGPSHTVGVRLLYDVPYFDVNLTLGLPAGTTSTGVASSNVSLFHTGATTWIVDPGLAPTPSLLFASATLTASPIPDTTPPTAVFTPEVGERLVPVDFDGSGSTDNVGVTNYTWNVTANGTTHTAHGAHVQFTFVQIGTFVVTLTVRDAAGNTGTVSHAVTVRDTTPPPTPTHLAAVVRQSAGVLAADLTWDAVSADDLAGYRVYASFDGGTTFRLEGQTGTNVTSFGDSLPAPGSVVQFRVTSLDRYGNEAPPSAAVQVTLPISTGPAPQSTFAILVLVVSLGIVAVAGIAAFLILRSRRRKEPPSDRGPVR